MRGFVYIHPHPCDSYSLNSLEEGYIVRVYGLGFKVQGLGLNSLTGVI